MKKTFFGGKQAPPFGKKKSKDDKDAEKSKSSNSPADEEKESKAAEKREAAEGKKDFGLKKVAKANRMKDRYAKAGAK